MAINTLQVKIIEAVYNSRNWIPRTGADATDIVNEKFIDTLSGIANFSLKYVVTHCQKGLTSPVFNLTVEGCVYNNLQYLTLTDATSLRNTVISQINNIMELDSYKDVRIYCSRDDTTSSSNFSYSASNDGLQSFIHSCEYHNNIYLDPTGANNISDFLYDLNTSLDLIDQFEYAGIIATSILKSGGSELFAATVATEYIGKKYLNTTELGDLRTSIKNELDSISNLTYGNVQVITGRNDNQSSDNY